jgi:uncharacterized membrane protein
MTTDPVEETRGAEADGAGLGFERVVFFSDAVFAIVITILVLPLTAEIEVPEGGNLAEHVVSLWPTVLTFVVSFLVVGQFWTAHHRTFDPLARQDGVLLSLNLVALLTVAFLPFPAALLGARQEADDAFPVVFFAMSMTLTSWALTATWLYAVHAKLLRPSVEPAHVRMVTVRGLVTSIAFVVSIPIAMLGLWPAIAVWLGVIPMARAFVARRLEPV